MSDSFGCIGVRLSYCTLSNTLLIRHTRCRTLPPLARAMAANAAAAVRHRALFACCTAYSSAVARMGYADMAALLDMAQGE